MNAESIIKNLKEKFASDIYGTVIRNERRFTIDINSDSLIRIAEYLFREAGFRFIIASAIHTRKGFEIYYHWSFDQIGLIMNLHVILDNKKPEIKSLSNMFEASNWIEREIHELFGINFLNHPYPEKLLSEGNWPDGEYPYRKDFD